MEVGLSLGLLLLGLRMVLIGGSVQNCGSLRWQTNLLLLVIDIGRLVLLPGSCCGKHATSVEDDLVPIHGDLADCGGLLCWRRVLMLVVLLLQLTHCH